MRKPVLGAWVLALAAAAASPLSAQGTPDASRTDVIAGATAYVTGYEAAFSLLVSEEHYVQEIRRPDNPGSNLSRANPGGGMQAGGTVRRVVLRSDYLLVQLGPGAGWMPFRDVFELNASKVRDREDRLMKLFLANDADRFELADRIMRESTRHNLGTVARTINIPTLAMMFLHPRVRDRFAFEVEGEDAVAGQRATRVAYREMVRPTLIKTTRGRDLILEGRLWLDPESGAVVRSEMNAADPAVRAKVSVAFRRDQDLGIWVPARMDEYYKADNSIDEIFATATYSNVRRFRVSTDEKIARPPGAPH